MPSPRQRLRRATFLLLTSAVVGCASDRAALRVEYSAVEKACATQVKQDKRIRRADWFSRWITCKTEYSMPLLIRGHPYREDDIRKMYARLNELAPKVDQNQYSMQAVYALWDEMMESIEPRRYLICNTTDDGGEHCIPRTTSGVYFAGRDGMLSPYVLPER
jgi:hypothetical protein